MKRFFCKSPDGQTGSALWLILVGVVLFAALSYAVSQNMRGGGETVASEEMAKNQATQILQFAASLKRAVQTMRIDGVDPTEIDFDAPGLAGYDNGACGLASCKVFDSGGGGVSYQKPLADWYHDQHAALTASGYGQYVFTGIKVTGIGTDCADPDTSCSDLVLLIPYIRKAICESLNNKLGVAAGDDTLSAFPGKFTGAYGTEKIGDDGTFPPGQQAGCFQGKGAGTYPATSYNFYQVLSAR